MIISGGSKRIDDFAFRHNLSLIPLCKIIWRKSPNGLAENVKKSTILLKIWD